VELPYPQCSNRCKLRPVGVTTSPRGTKKTRRLAKERFKMSISTMPLIITFDCTCPYHTVIEARPRESVIGKQELEGQKPSPPRYGAKSNPKESGGGATEQSGSHQSSTSSRQVSRSASAGSAEDRDRNPLPHPSETRYYRWLWFSDRKPVCQSSSEAPDRGRMERESKARSSSHPSVGDRTEMCATKSTHRRLIPPHYYQADDQIYLT
jgi:hypothetical protein